MCKYWQFPEVAYSRLKPQKQSGAEEGGSAEARGGAQLKEAGYHKNGQTEKQELLNLVWVASRHRTSVIKSWEAPEVCGSSVNM